MYKKNIILFIFIVLLSSCDVTEPIIENYSPEGTYHLSWEDLTTIDKSKDLKIGGFTGLTYAGRRNFYAITSRGPSIEEFKVENGNSYLIEPDYSPRILLLELQDDKSIKIINETQLTNPFEELVKGFSPPSPYNSNETFLNDNASFDDWNIDPSGLYFDINENLFWICDKYGPTFFQATREGKLVTRIRPNEGFRNTYLKRRMDGGFNGIAFNPEGKIYGITKRVLNNLPDDTSDLSTLNKRMRRLQVQNLDVLNIETDVCYLYYVEPEEFDGLEPDNVFLGDIAFVNDTTFLVTEYGELNGVKRSLLYKINIDPEQTFEAKLGHEALRSKTIETLTETDRDELNIKPVIKTLLLDLKNSEIKNPESIAIINENKIAIIDNNKFGITSGNISSKSYSLDKKSITLQVFNLEKPLNIEKK